MDNLIFDNNIRVSVSQTPANPTHGDEVIFKANVSIDNTTEIYNNTSTYFFSYTWLVSSDDGNSFYTIGQDLDTLVISNIDDNFFNSIYKVKVALINLDNIILTEDGENLTTQFGEILLGNANLTSLSIQSAADESTSSIPKNKSDSNTTALDISNVQFVIDEATTYDPTINDSTAAEVYSGQIDISRQSNTLNPTSTDNIPDPDISVPSTVLGIQADDRYDRVVDKKPMQDCATYKFYKCVPKPNGQYASISDCPGCRDSGNTDQVTKFYINNGRIDHLAIPVVANYINYVLEDISENNSYSFYCCDLVNDKLCSGGPAVCNVSTGAYGPPAGSAGCDSFWVYPTDYNYNTDKFAVPDKFDIYFNSIDNYKSGRIFSTNWPRNNKRGVDRRPGEGDFLQPQNPVPPSSPPPPVQQHPPINANNTCGCKDLGSIFLYAVRWAWDGTVDTLGKLFNIFALSAEHIVGHYVCKTKYYNMKKGCQKKLPFVSDGFGGAIPQPPAYTPIVVKKGDKAEDKWSEITIPGPTYDCKCINITTGAEAGGSISVIQGYGELSKCNYYVASETGPTNSKCLCTVNNADTIGNSARDQSGSADIMRYIDFKRVYEFTTAKEPPECKPHISKNSSFRTCYDTTQCSCGNGQCDGVYCCESTTFLTKTIWTLTQNAPSTHPCKESVTVSSVAVSSCSNAAPGSVRTIVAYAANEKLRDCGETTNGSTTFDSLNELKTYIQNLSAKNKFGAVLVTTDIVEDAAKKAALQDNTWGEYWMNGTPTGLLLNDGCESCEKAPIYNVSCSSSGYDCNDNSIDLCCNNNFGCNLSSGSSDIVKCTITELKNPTLDEIAQASRKEGGYRLTVGEAKAYATSSIGQSPGIICPGECP